jgi:hypothetical protein
MQQQHLAASLHAHLSIAMLQQQLLCLLVLPQVKAAQRC